MKAFILSLLLIQALSQDDPENTQKSVMDSQKCSEANSLGAQISQRFPSNRKFERSMLLY